MLEPIWTTTASHKSRSSPRQRLREAIVNGQQLVIPGVYDGLSARIAEITDFECLLTSPSLIAHGLTGTPDPERLGINQLADTVSRICGVVSLPVVVEYDATSVTPSGVAYAVKALERAGAAAICLATSESRPVGEASLPAKVLAAVSARQDPGLVFAVHCGRGRSVSPADVIALSNACLDAGAEIAALDQSADETDLIRFGAEIRAGCRLVMMQGVGMPSPPLQALRKMGYTMAAFEQSFLHAASLRLIDFVNDLGKRGTAGDLALLDRLRGLPIEDWYQFTGFDRIGAMEVRYLPAAADAPASGPELPYYRPSSGSDGQDKEGRS